MKIAYLDKKFIRLDKAKVSILDRGFLYGDGAFETMRAYDGAVFLIEEHIERLFKTLKTLRIPRTIGKKKIKKAIYSLLKKSKLKNAYIKIIITRGKSHGLLIPDKIIKPTVAIYALPYEHPLRNMYKKGIKVNISEESLNGQNKIIGLKTLNYLNNVLYKYEAAQKGFADTIFINTAGFISEASSSNIFFVKKRKMYTPSFKCGILPGITRKEIMRLSAKFLKHKITETFAKRKDLYKASEIFLTNSLKGIIPVVKIGKHTVGTGKPGPVTKGLMVLFKRSIDKYGKAIT